MHNAAAVQQVNRAGNLHAGVDGIRAFVSSGVHCPSTGETASSGCILGAIILSSCYTHAVKWVQLLTSAILPTAMRESESSEAAAGSSGVEISSRLVGAG